MLWRAWQAVFILLITPLSYADEPPLKLWYSVPANHWEQALPLGNGRLGAMVYGGVVDENIQLNEDTFWAGGPHNNLNPKARDSLGTIRALINRGDYLAASELAQHTITSSGAQGMPYQTAGNLRLHFKGHEQYTDYYRELDLDTALVRTHYTIGDVTYEREVFSSFTDSVLVIRLQASKPQALSFDVTFDHPAQLTVSADGHSRTLKMFGKSSDHEGVRGAVELTNFAKIVRVDGAVAATAKSLKISNASDVIILVSLATNFNNYRDLGGDADRRALQRLSNAEKRFSNATAYTAQRAAHSEFYQQYFHRVSLNLGDSEAANQATDQRINNYTKQFDPALVTLYFQYGRYLLISSSQPDTQPANLQGIWNPSLQPAWDSKYTLNINAEMNYWPAEITNLAELHEPFIQLIRDLSETGKDAARIMYGARGWVAHHNTDIWRISGAVDWSWGSWPTSNAWLVRHLWQKYLYSGDLAYLQSVYPIMKGACEFFEDFLETDPDTGWLVVSPSISPENEPAATGTKIAKGVTMDNQLMLDLFNNTLSAANLLNADRNSQKKWQDIIRALPPMQIGRYHQLQEWLEDWDSPFDKHRHVSHLYGLHPSNQISPLRTPELFNAAKVSLEQRGDPSTGWSVNWKINLWARLLDGDRALKLIGEQIRPATLGDGDVAESGGTYPNLLDAHPPFQIDGNFGFTAGVAEMLVQSHDGAVHLLPALPQAWPRGEVRGLVTRGGFVVDMVWEQGQVTELKVHSRLGGNLRLRSFAPLPLEKSLNTKAATGVNPNPFFALPPYKKPLKHTRKQMPRLALDNLYEVDISTIASNDYVWRVDTSISQK